MNALAPYRIALIPGDGIGQEVVPAAARVLASVDIPIEFVELNAGWSCFEKTGTALPTTTLNALQNCSGALFGATSSPNERVDGYSSPIIGMRRALDLYANLRPIYSVPVQLSRPNVDLLIVRENTEGLYVKRERLEDNGSRAVAERVISRSASTRIARMAFEQARLRRGKRRVTIVHKANVLSLTDGLFRESALDVARAFPEIEVEEQLVDSMLYRMIREPERYDVVVAPNLYGDILSDGAAALTGGLGLASSANVGEGFIVAEPVHGSAPDIAGRGIANPMATVLAAAQLLDHLGEPDAAVRMRAAVHAVLADGAPRTPDLGGHATTDDVTSALIHALHRAKRQPVSTDR